MTGLVAAIVAATGVACGGEEGRCGRLARLCAADGEWKAVAPRVEDAVEVDLDGDGELEMVVLDRSGQQLAVAWPDGPRTTWFLNGEAPVAIAGLPGALAVASTEPPVVALYGADASGRLERRSAVVLPDEPAALKAVDLAGDGAPELLVTIPEAGVIAVIDPAKGTMHEVPAGRNPLQLDTGDVDGDGILDVVVVDVGRALQVFFGTGDGQLRAAAASPAVAQMQWIDLADHDGDGDLDAFTRADSTRALVHRNDGAGRFSSPIALPFTAPADGAGLIAGPLAAGGLVGVSVPTERGFATWFGKGSTWLGRVDQSLESGGSWVGASVDGGLLIGGQGFVRRCEFVAQGAAVEIWRDFSVQSEVFSSAVTTGDLDGDPLLDVAAVLDDRLLVFRGRADRSLEKFAELDVEVDLEPMSMAIADVTGDGLADILVSDVTRVWLAQSQADGSYTLHPPHEAAGLAYKLVPLRTGPAGPATIAVIPVNDATGAFGGLGASLLRFAADGSVAEEVVFADSRAVLGAAPVDLDADGVEELLMYSRTEDTLHLDHMVPDGMGLAVAATYDLAALAGLAPHAFRPSGVAVGDLDGDGAVEALVGSSQAVVRVSGLASGDPAATVLKDIQASQILRDLDGDGRLDVATAIGYAYYFHRGRGDGTFEPEVILNDFVDVTAGAFAAVPDAQFDVVTLSRGGIATYLTRPVVLPSQTSGRAFHGLADDLVVGDVDADGHADVVTASNHPLGGLGVLWGGEADPLARGRGHGTGTSRRALAVGDLDGDGELEVVASGTGGGVQAYPFRPDARDEPIDVAALPDSYVQALAVGDLDGDGLADLVALRRGAGIVVSLARGTGPLQFAPFSPGIEVTADAGSTLELGDVDGDGDLDVLVRSNDAVESTLVLTGAGGTWSEATVLEGYAATFSPPDAAGRVELVTQEGTSIHRHDRGAPDRRTLLLEGDPMNFALLRRVADVDRDGRYDLVLVDDDGTHVWLRGEDGMERVTLTDVPLDVVWFADIDGDDRPDAVGLRNGVLFVRRTRT
ncbi:FG-GAP repeat domain-containing protein [Nannocystis punicea]|uniref:VCBS repeat-containing protein n=1 Tax=Nannocystis punicea TaxID=2995304 RepID=A0ABY7GUF8_9BACT|nr:VCBS repeat-containing protein [Nannocystis poenicansa]WAS90597.1 VCBS repeat-containing protein [Nannocystis poenicansa]